MRIEAAKRVKQDSVAKQLESLERQLQDARRTGDNDWAKELEQEIEILKQKKS